MVGALALGELWTPDTDRGVVIQLVATLLLIAAVTYAVRRERALVLLTLGVGMIILSWYGLRALH